MAKEKNIKIPKDVAEKVLMLDCRKDDNVRRLEKSLMKLSFIKSEADLQTDNLERIIVKLESKGTMNMSYIMRNNIEGRMLYTGMLRADTAQKDGEWIKSVNGITLWETLAKAVFYIYYYLQSLKEGEING